MAWISANTAVSYYEPLQKWTLTVKAAPKASAGSSFVDEWKPKVYQTSFVLSAKGQEIGVASLEYTPPLLTRVK